VKTHFTIGVFTYCSPGFRNASVVHAALVQALRVVACIRLIQRRTLVRHGIDWFDRKES
jgi:hypothetical protein